MFKRIDHVEITPSNLQRSVEFYSNVLGFAFKSRHTVNAGPIQEIVYLTLGDTMLELLGMAGPVAVRPEPQAVGYRMMALEVEDMGKAIAHLRSKGVPIAREPMDVGGSKRAEIQDPDGLRIELRQWGT